MKLLRAMVPALSAALRAPARLVGRGRALHATAARGAGSGGLFEDATALVGNTPVVKISDKLAPPGVEVYAKCEYFNPLASVKDRLAVAIIEDAEKRGELKPGMTVVEATSGNTGIAGGLCINQKFKAPSTRRLLDSVKVPVPHCSSADSLVDLHRRWPWSARSAATTASSAWPSPSPSSAAASCACSAPR